MIDNSNKLLYEIPQYGEILFNTEGLVVCHICRRAFKKLGTHVVQKHDMTIAEYKKEFGLNNNTITTSKEYHDRMRDYNTKYFDLVVGKNLKEKGQGTRFKEGSKGRPREVVREQERRRLKEGIKKIGKPFIKGDNRIRKVMK